MIVENPLFISIGGYFERKSDLFPILAFAWGNYTINILQIEDFHFLLGTNLNLNKIS